MAAACEEKYRREKAKGKRDSRKKKGRFKLVPVLVVSVRRYETAGGVVVVGWGHAEREYNKTFVCTLVFQHTGVIHATSCTPDTLHPHR